MSAKQTKVEEHIPGGTHPFFYHTIVSNLTPDDLRGKVILDIGCGRGINGFLIRASRDLTSAKMIGMDVNDYYLNFCKKHLIFDQLVNKRLPKLPFKDKSIDFVLCSEVIEHLTRKDGLVLLKEIDRVCRGRALITTPNMFFQTIPGEEEDSHKSLWTLSDFRRRGYKVYGMGLKTPLLWGDPLIKIKQALYFIITPFSYLFPQIGAYIIASKDY